MSNVHCMTIHKYIPDRMFGFCIDPAGMQVFFHLAVFEGGGVPPILGEMVEVHFDAAPNKTTDKAPRALSVVRTTPTFPIEGVVEMFDGHRGFGFVLGSDKVSYHLHTSEILEKRIPRKGQSVSFFPGTRQGRPRACHVKVC